jgi:iron complex outermembrane recepter protein
VEAPKPRPARRAAPAAPARTATRPPRAPTPTRPAAPTTPTTTTAGQPAAASPFQPPPSLDTITSNQIQANQAQSFGNLLFTTPGATSAGLSPAASRPVLRGLKSNLALSLAI